MAPPFFGGSANIANTLAGFTSKFTDVLEFVSRFTNILVNLLVIDHSICNVLPCNISSTMLAFHRPFGLSREVFLVNVELYSHRLLVYMTTVFFSEIVLWRNCLINRVGLFEEK